jgi:Rad3-related DNA helicase
LRAVQSKLVALAGMKGRWIVDDLKVWSRGQTRVIGVRFDPVWPAPYAEGVLFRGIPKVLLVSATIRPKTPELLGIRGKDFKFIEFGSSFPVVRRPIYFLPTARLSSKSSPADFTKIVKKADEIIKARLDRNGLIHTVSYQRQLDFDSQTAYRDILFVPKSKTTKADLVSFKMADPPALFASPAIDTGYDFPMTDAEYQIILKVPFPDTRSEVMKARLQEDREYGNYLVAQTLVQMAGRIVRSAEDRGETFILDSHAGWFVWGNKHLFPKYFLNAWRKIEGGIVPKPPAKLIARVKEKAS